MNEPFACEARDEDLVGAFIRRLEDPDMRLVTEKPHDWANHGENGKAAILNALRLGLQRFEDKTLADKMERLAESCNEIAIGYNDSGCFWTMHFGNRGTGSMIESCIADSIVSEADTFAEAIGDIYAQRFKEERHAQGSDERPLPGQVDYDRIEGQFERPVIGTPDGVVVRMPDGGVLPVNGDTLYGVFDNHVWSRSEKGEWLRVGRAVNFTPPLEPDLPVKATPIQWVRELPDVGRNTPVYDPPAYDPKPIIVSK